jgi:hypothetical protein
MCHSTQKLILGHCTQANTQKPIHIMSCTDCFRGGVSGSEPSGTETTIHGIPTYVAQPEDGVTPKGMIVFITDAFGWKFVNNRVLSDQYAKKGGFLVYCPDFMDGTWSPHPRLLKKPVLNSL